MNSDEIVTNEEVEEEKSDLEKLLERLAALKEIVPYNFWHAKTLAELEEEAQESYDAEGVAIPVVDPVLPLNTQFSPPEVIAAEGWQRVHVLPSGVGRIRRGHWLSETGSKDGPDYSISEGLEISNSRSNGCFRIRNLDETAAEWAADPEKWAKIYSSGGRIVSPRLLLMAAADMSGFKFMFPTFNYRGWSKRPDYAFEPAIAPFNEEEKFVWRWMFSRYHMDAWKGGLSFFRNVQARPDIRDTKKREPVDPNEKHKLLAIANHPNWILPAAMQRFNTDKFKHEPYDKARGDARLIDGGAARVPGYTHPREWGAEDTPEGLEAWYKKYEHNNRVSFPNGRSEFIEE
jgi:hypothetical protein